ncbi:transcription factor bHLH93-like [Amaranthus tricolor]|uniref:transcription factor bHLH93-like n=1 Tax=Amaranthus tricolor TaxID=29722 RepID=UPI00258BB4FF|nr:transcription factor bHLH93-like [Amaranthus tricolor]
MEMNEDGFLEELLALRRDQSWETNPSPTHHDQINGFFSSPSWPTFNGLDSTTLLPNTNTTTTTLDCSSFFVHPSSTPFDPTFPDPGPGSGPNPEHEYSISMIEPHEQDHDINNNNMIPCKAEHSMTSGEVELEMEIPPALSPPAAFNIGVCMVENKRTCNKMSSKVKKVEGQPSKNLMAERRRRKRLNDRLSMLRSVVPKISKMDRTSILGDTIDYMKELLERINSLQEEVDTSPDHFDVMTMFKDDKPTDVLVRNSPKFDVDRRNMDTRVEICCAGKPGLLLSTITTLEAMGLEIQQCVISCFNDFSLQANCAEEMEHKALISSEDIKQALFRNAGYGGRCL